tara:strand:+ start:2077 stop:2325 length:249 start_codon:yes stop_codon:yes gene_type:complete
MHYVTRAIDGAILAKDGKWYLSLADAGDIKIFKRLSNAERHGLGRIPQSMYKQELGNMSAIGTVHTIREGYAVNRVGQQEPA